MRRPGRVGVGLVLCALALLSAVRQQTWQDERRLWAGAVAHSPDKPRPWINLGQQYARHGEDGMADDAFAWASVLAQRPSRSREEQVRAWAMADTNRAILRMQHGEVTAAKALLIPVIARTPYQTPQRVMRWIEQGSPSVSPPSF